jgi:bifunctional non-homologous end joining protein LigD
MSRKRLSVVIPGSEVGPMPATLSPQLATVAKKLPALGEWVSELKWDCYRLMVWIDRGRVRLLTRNGHNWTDRMPRLAAHFIHLNVEQAVIDGELVALRRDGTDSFHDL